MRTIITALKTMLEHGEDCVSAQTGHHTKWGITMMLVAAWRVKVVQLGHAPRAAFYQKIKARRSRVDNPKGIATR